MTECGEAVREALEILRKISFNNSLKDVRTHECLAHNDRPQCEISRSIKAILNETGNRFEDRLKLILEKC